MSKVQSLRMELKQLAEQVPESLLSGVDRLTTKHEDWSGDMVDAQAIRFRLQGNNGKPWVFMAIEDPSDGYRSSMKEMVVMKAEEVDPPMTNTFEPVKVTLEHQTEHSDDGDACDILVVKRKDTGKIVLEVGTGNTSDYYPYFMSSFDAEALGEVQVTDELVDMIELAEKEKEMPEGWGSW